MKSRIIICAWWIAVVLICCRIFAFSAENADKSSATSTGLIRAVIDFLPGTKALPDDVKMNLCKNLNHIVRKAAHFSVYAALGFCTLGAINATFGKTAVAVTLLCCCVYACTDEVHQLFVGGRAGRVSDVIIDTVGSSFGVAVYMILRFFVNKLKHNRA